MKNINKHNALITCLLLAVVMMVTLLGSCKKAESNIQVVSNDMTKPETVSNVKVENFNGSAKITYTLPNSKNLLYVLARYHINDNRVRETNASYYTDTITVDGFARAQEYEVTLYTVSRANVKSDPVVVKVNPKTPNYLLINSQLAITPDFGGANFFGLNPNKVPVAVHVVAFNETTNVYDEQEPEYINGDTINVSVRGFSPKPSKFGVYTTDRFGNVSDTVFRTLTPLQESLLDKSKFFTYHLPSDSPIYPGWDLRNLFDGNTGEPGWHTFSAPKTLGTFGIGMLSKISRLVVWQRKPDVFSYQNTRTFTIWGSAKDAPQDTDLPRNSAPGTVAGDWVNMGNFVFGNPQSGLPPSQANAADKDLVAKGVNFKMSISAPAVKFIRYECTQTWGGQDYVNVLEVSFYGNPQ